MLAFAIAFGAMLVGHALADTVLQPGWLSVKKRDPEHGVIALMLHGSAHGLMVALVTSSAGLALAEYFLHPLIDHLKARGWFGMWVDQALHVACKLLWAAIAVGLLDAT